VVNFNLPLWFFCLAYDDIVKDNNESTLVLSLD